MSDHLTIDYRGYSITYSENQDVWRCWSLDIEADRLPTLKGKIDRLIVASRKLANPLPVIRVDYHGRVAPVKVLGLAQPRKDRAGKELEPDAAWCMVPDEEWYFDHDLGQRRKRPIEKREKVRLEQLFVDSPENREAVVEANRIKAEIDRLTGRRGEVLKGMARVSSAIFKIADPAEGDDA